jgi:hypothetical protein
VATSLLDSAENALAAVLVVSIPFPEPGALNVRTRMSASVAGGPNSAWHCCLNCSKMQTTRGRPSHG